MATRLHKRNQSLDSRGGREWIDISEDGIIEAIHYMKMMPHEFDRAMRNSQRTTGAYIRKRLRALAPQYTRVDPKLLSRRKRIQGSRARGWFGANRVPIEEVRGLQRRESTVEYVRGQGSKKGERKVKIESRKGRKKRTAKKLSYTRRVTKVFIDGVYHPDMFVIPKFGHHVFRRGKSGKLEQVYKSLWKDARRMEDDLVPEVRDFYNKEFLRQANEWIETRQHYRTTYTHKGQVEDRLAFIKMLRTNIR